MSGMKSRRKLLLAVAILAAVLVLGLLLKGMDAGRSEASGSAEEDLSSETAQLLANAGGTFPEDISADDGIGICYRLCSEERGTCCSKYQLWK